MALTPSRSHARSRKGLLYILFSILFLALITLVLLTTIAYRHQDRTALAKTRIHTTDDFIKGFHEDIKRATFISSFRAMLGLEEYLSTQGVFFDNQTIMEEAFRQAFLNGSINGTALAILDNASFTDYLSRVQAQADTIGVLINATITQVTLTQQDPWTVIVELEGSFIVTDRKHSSWWDYNRTFSTTVPIYGLKDPLYTVNTYGRVPNTIANFSLPSTGFVNDTDNSTTILKEFLDSSSYRESTSAPSFLQRFINDLAPSPLGIESLVNLPLLSDQGITVLDDRSVVDYIYFSTSPNGSTDHCHIQGMILTPDWFRLDDDHMDDYELDGFTSSSCP